MRCPHCQGQPPIQRPARSGAGCGSAFGVGHRIGHEIVQHQHIGQKAHGPVDQMDLVAAAQPRSAEPLDHHDVAVVDALRVARVVDPDRIARAIGQRGAVDLLDAAAACVAGFAASIF